MSKKIDTYAQCRFTREGEGGSQMGTTAYIDASSAQVGKRMTFKGSDDIWTVTYAGQPGPKPRHTVWGGMD